MAALATGTSTFLSGDESLKQFPPHLVEQLKENCREHNSRNPTCIISHRDDGELEFIDPYHTPGCPTGPEETLLVARHRWSDGAHILVARQSQGNSLFGGDAFILVFRKWTAYPYLWLPNWNVWTHSRFKDPVVFVVKLPRLKLSNPMLLQGIMRIVDDDDLDEPYTSELSLRNKFASGNGLHVLRPIHAVDSGHKRLATSFAEQDYDVEQFGGRKRARVARSGAPDTTATGQDTAQDTNQIKNIMMVFLAATDGVENRRESYKACNTIQRLFGQSLCARTIRKHDEFLKIDFGGTESVFVMEILRD